MKIIKRKPSPAKIQEQLKSLTDLELMEVINATNENWHQEMGTDKLLKDDIRHNLEQLCMAQYLYAVNDSIAAGTMPYQYMETDEQIIPS